MDTRNPVHANFELKYKEAMDQRRELPHVVIVGAGFGGLNVAKGLRHAPVRITVVDRNNFHLFQPLLYQVATAGLSPADIAQPIRSVLSSQKNAEVIMEEVIGLDASKKLVRLPKRSLRYDYLVLAMGSSHSYFGHDAWEKFAPGLKTISDATKIRLRVLSAFESAEEESSPEIRKALLRFVIVGGGPTGVELAGSVAELAHRAIARDFRHIDPTSAEVLLIEAGSRVLAGFDPSLSAAAQKKLEQLGVRVMTGCRVLDIDQHGVTLSNERISTRSVIWAAGVIASPAGKWLSAPMDRAGRVMVEPDLSVPGHPDVFVIGDSALRIQDGKPLPGVAPVAMQMGKFVAAEIRSKLAGKPSSAFRYWNKGNLATVGRTFAVAEIGRLKLKGFLAWVTWVVVHIFYLIGFRSRVIVLMEWAWMYLTFQRGARLIIPQDHSD